MSGDLELFLQSDGAVPLIGTLGFVACGIVLATLVPQRARAVGMDSPWGWTVAVAVFGPLGFAAFLVARRRQAALLHALEDAGVEPTFPTGAVNPEARKAADGMVALGVALLLVGIALTIVLSSGSSVVVCIGLFGSGVVLLARGLARRRGA